MSEALPTDLETPRLVLRVLGPADAPLAQAFYSTNREFLSPWEPERTPSFYTLTEQRRLLAAEEIDMRAGRRLVWWLVPRGEEHAIGTVKLTNVVRGVFDSCLLGYKLAEAAVGRGYMTEGLRPVIELAFGGAGLHRIEANIMPRNTRSLAVVQRLGFREEGLAQRYLKIAGTWEDHLRMAMLADEWRPG